MLYLDISYSYHEGSTILRLILYLKYDKLSAAHLLYTVLQSLIIFNYIVINYIIIIILQ